MSKVENIVMIIFIISAAVLFSLSAIFAEKEDITITTYYSSPFGSYEELRANQISVGSSYASLSSIPANSVIISGNMGIGTSLPTIVASPANGATVGNLDVRDVWIRKVSNWASLISGAPSLVFGLDKPALSGGYNASRNPWCSGPPSSNWQLCHYNQNIWDLTNMEIAAGNPSPRLCILGGVRRQHGSSPDYFQNAKVYLDTSDNHWKAEIWNPGLNVDSDPYSTGDDSSCWWSGSGGGTTNCWWRGAITCFY
jgi:hypothetical protein